MERIIALVLAGTVSFALAGAAQADSRMGDGPRGGQMMPNFSSLDADKDGKITKEEMMAQHAARFTEMDADKNGTLSAEELAAAHVARAQTKAAEHAARMLEKRDANKDGVLSADELSPKEDRMAKMFARMDADSDGAVSEEELTKMQERMMQRMEKHSKKGHGEGHRKHGWFE
ncbi:MAG TPA: calcium-binding protein [Rhodobacteraceae bacterium]|jgi:Ca2+-binding EF-hand superfamily protein|nr:calcium-binding protein [Paracoccaceae bacterium]